MLFPEYRPKDRSAVPKEQPRHQVQKFTYRLYDVKERACAPENMHPLQQKSRGLLPLAVCLLQKRQMLHARLPSKRAKRKLLATWWLCTLAVNHKPVHT